MCEIDERVELVWAEPFAASRVVGVRVERHRSLRDQAGDDARV